MKEKKMFLMLLICCLGMLVGFSNEVIADTMTSTVGITFYLPEEEKGIHFKENEDGKYIQNLEMYSLEITKENGEKITSKDMIIYTETNNIVSIVATMAPDYNEEQ